MLDSSVVTLVKVFVVALVVLVAVPCFVGAAVLIVLVVSPVSVDFSVVLVDFSVVDVNFSVVVGFKVGVVFDLWVDVCMASSAQGDLKIELYSRVIIVVSS